MISARAIATRGIGSSPLAMAMLGFQETSIPLATNTGGAYPWPFVYPKSSHLPQRTRRARHQRDADLIFMHRL